MRQLVSVVTEQAVSYYLTEGDDQPVIQVASVLNTGLEVDAVIDLGSNLLGALRLNGHKSHPRALPAPPAAKAPADTQPALEPAPPPPRKKAGRPPGPSKRPMTFWGFSQPVVLEDLRAHPGTTYAEAVLRITKGQDPRANVAYSAALNLVSRALVQRGGGIRRERVPGTSVTGRKVSMTRLYLEEPTPPEPRPEE